MVLDETVEDRFAGVAERRVAEIVSEGGSVSDLGGETEVLRQLVLIRSQSLCQAASHLGDLQGVREAVVKAVTLGRGDDLRDPCEATEGRGVQDPVSVALKRGTVVLCFSLVPPLATLISHGSRRAALARKLRSSWLMQP